MRFLVAHRPSAPSCTLITRFSTARFAACYMPPSSCKTLEDVLVSLPERLAAHILLAYNKPSSLWGHMSGLGIVAQSTHRARHPAANTRDPKSWLTSGPIYRWAHMIVALSFQRKKSDLYWFVWFGHIQFNVYFQFYIIYPLDKFLSVDMFAECDTACKDRLR